MKEDFIIQEDLLNLENKSIFLKSRKEIDYSYDYEVNGLRSYKLNDSTDWKIVDEDKKGNIYYLN